MSDMKPRSRQVTEGLERAAARGMLRAVGIRATIRIHPPAQRVQLLSAGKVDIAGR